MTNPLTEVNAFACISCGIPLPMDRELKKCNPCQEEQIRQWRENMTMRATKEFPGVDIDAIHYKLGAVRVKDAA